MDKFLIRRDAYEDLIEKGYGKRDLSKLTKKQITDKNGHKRTVYVKNGEQPAAQKQPTAQKELSPEKRARYEEMLEKVKNGPDEYALFVSTKGMLNKKDAIAHLEAKLGKKPVNSAYEGHLESENPPNTDITKEDEERFGKQALSGLSGKRTGNNDYEGLMARKKVEYSDKVKKQGYDYQELRETGELPDGLSSKALREIRDKAKKDGSQNENTRNLVLAAQERLDELSRENYAKKQAKKEPYDDDKAFTEYKELVTKDNHTDEEYKRIGELVNQHFDHSNKPWPGGAKLKEEAKKTETPKKADTSSLSKEDKINILSEYQSKMYKDVPVEKWKEAYNKVSEKELNDGFNKFAENHSKKIEQYKENYLDARNEAGKDIAENNKIQKLSDKIEFSPEEMKMIRDTAAEIGYRVGRDDEGKLLNAIYSKDKAMYSALTNKNQKVWDESGKTQKTFSTTDLLKEKIQSMKGDFGADDPETTKKMKAAENKKEIDRLMKVGFDRRSAYAKVALDEIEERLNNEMDDDIRATLFNDMRDIQSNGLNAKYFEKHKDEYGF